MPSRIRVVYGSGEAALLPLELGLMKQRDLSG